MSEFGNPEIVEEEVDILLIGGGMACCGAAFELSRWLQKARDEGIDLKTKMVDKAALIVPVQSHRDCPRSTRTWGKTIPRTTCAMCAVT